MASPAPCLPPPPCRSCSLGACSSLPPGDLAVPCSSSRLVAPPRAPRPSSRPSSPLTPASTGRIPNPLSAGSFPRAGARPRVPRRVHYFAVGLPRDPPRLVHESRALWRPWYLAGDSPRVRLSRRSNRPCEHQRFPPRFTSLPPPPMSTALGSPDPPSRRGSHARGVGSSLRVSRGLAAPGSSWVSSGVARPVS